MINLDLRKAELKDIPGIVEVRLASVEEEETRGFSRAGGSAFSSVEKLKKVWAEGNRLSDGYGLVVAEKNGRIVGFIVFKVENDYGYIDNIHVARNQQRRGVGRALVAYVESTVKANGCPLMKTDTTENNAGILWKSYGFWVSMGYRDTGERLHTEWGFKIIPFIKNLC
jgi:ribosomal protein S18 acetylase RimI-like enzyme